MNRDGLREEGFTLIETIVVLVIVAIMSTFIFTYSTSKSVTGSANPIQWIQNASQIHQIMEMITADYKGYPQWKPSTPYTTTSRVTPIERNGYFYQPTANCTSGLTEPATWSTANGSTSTEGGTGCTWRVTYQLVAANPYPNPILPLSVLRQKIAGGVAGVSGEGSTLYYTGSSATQMQYKIVNNRYINPATSWDTAVATSVGYLKVTLQRAGGGETLTAIFTD